MSTKRRSRGSGSIRKRGQALYLRFRPPGQSSQVEQSFPRSEAESMPDYRARAEAALVALTQGLLTRTRTAPTARTVQELADSYLFSLRNEIKPRTYEGYDTTIRVYILPELAGKKVSRLTAEDIRAFQHRLLDKQVAGNKRIAVSTARLAMSSLHDMINYAMDGQDNRESWGISFDPWPRRRLRWPDDRQRPAPHTYPPYTIDETRAFIAATPEQIRPHILCAILLMLRDGELRAMRWKHLDEDNGLYFVHETQSRKHGFTSTKTPSSQAAVPVPEILLEELRAHRTRQAEMKLRKGQKWQEHGLVFTTSKGTPLIYNWYGVGPKHAIATEANVRPVSFHTLRKTGASLLESLGVSRSETQEALRHKRTTVTDGYVSVYMRQRREHIEDLARTLVDVPSFPQSSLKVG